MGQLLMGSRYGSERLLASGSSASSASSSLGESSTAGCLPFSARPDGARLDDASAWPCGDGLADELDIPSASVQCQRAWHSSPAHRRVGGGAPCRIGYVGLNSAQATRVSNM